MAQLTDDVSEFTNTKSICIQTGPGSIIEDTIGGFLNNLNHQTEYFAKVVRSNPAFANGFNAIGLSQGGLVIRAYIERYNDPPVLSFISIHVPQMGVASIPQCDADDSPLHVHSKLIAKLCEQLTSVLGVAAYDKTIQENLAQANMLRVPDEINLYLQGNVFLPDINNEKFEGSVKEQEYKKRFSKLNKLVLIRAKEDTMVFPSESEWFGTYKDGGWAETLTMNQTEVYKRDVFGLKTLHQSGKIVFKETKGNHLRFSLSELHQWLELTASSSSHQENKVVKDESTKEIKEEEPIVISESTYIRMR